MINIQNEVQKIHHQYGMSEMANYKIQLLCEQYAKDYHDSELKKLNIPDVVGQSEQLVCPDCTDSKGQNIGNMYRCDKCGRLVS